MPVYKLPDEGVNIILYILRELYRRVRVCRYGDAGDVVGMVSVVRGQRRNGVLWWCARGVMYVCSGSVGVVVG